MGEITTTQGVNVDEWPLLFDVQRTEYEYAQLLDCINSSVSDPYEP